MTRQSKWKIQLFIGVIVAVFGIEGFNHRLQGEEDSDINGKLILAQTISEPKTNTDQELKIALISGKPVLVDFGSNKCIPCRQLRPILKEVEKEMAGKAHVLIIDIYNFGKLAREHRVQLIPTLIFFNSSSKEIYRHMGVWDKKSIIDKLKSTGEES
jgi:thioredoxin 1